MLSDKHNMQGIRCAALCALLSGGLGAVGLGCEGQQQTDRSSGYQPPVIDDTRARGILLPNGEQQAQTIADVDPGMASTAREPACIGTGLSGATAACVNVCVRMPLGSILSKVESFAWERGVPGWPPCSSRTCLNQTPSQAKAMFDRAGYVEERIADFDRVCWVFRNWHPSRSRQAILLITFRAPKG